MTWLRIFHFGIEIRKGAPILAAAPQTMSVPLARLDLDTPFFLPSWLPDNPRLHIHLEGDEKTPASVGGRPVCFTLIRGRLQPAQRFSRLRGVLDIGVGVRTRTFGLTAAHGLYQILVSS